MRPTDVGASTAKAVGVKSRSPKPLQPAQRSVIVTVTVCPFASFEKNQIMSTVDIENNDSRSRTVGGDRFATNRVVVRIRRGAPKTIL